MLRSPVQQAQARADALRQLLRIGAIGLGTGVAGRSLIELPRWLNGRPSLLPTGTAGARPQVELHGLHDDERRSKLAVAQAQPASLFQSAADAFVPTPTTTRPLGDWWGPAAAMGTAGLGLTGGWKLTDWLLDKQRKASEIDELERTKQEWQQAMADEYRAAMLAKQAGDDLGVDALFDALAAREPAGGEKRADALEMLQAPWTSVVGHDNWQYGKGVTLAAMLASGLGAGYATFNANRKNSRRKILERALRDRARKRQSASPPPIMVAPMSFFPPPRGDVDRELTASQRTPAGQVRLA